MSYGGYQQYGGNPYGDVEQGGGGYGSTQQPTGGYGSSNPYGSQAAPQQQPIDLQQSQSSSYATGPTQTQSSAYPPAPTSSILSNPDFLARVESTRSDIRQLNTNVTEISTIHQRILGSPDNTSSAQLESLVTQTQILNTRIKDQIKFLETDAAKSNRNPTKDSQIKTLKGSFKTQLEDYQKEELEYRNRYREQIRRQYAIVNPDASQQEIDQAANTDWGDEGVFQTALKTNRTAAATSVLGSVRARHADIQNIERTLLELQQLFEQLAAQVEQQDVQVTQAEQQTDNVKNDTVAGNKQLDKGVKSARRYRKGKWICFFIVLAIVIALALILGLYFGLRKTGSSSNNNSNNSNSTGM